MLPLQRERPITAGSSPPNEATGTGCYNPALLSERQQPLVPRLLRAYLLLALLGLAACGTAQPLAATASPSPVPTEIVFVTPTVAPSPTSTDTPTPSPTPVVSDLERDDLKVQIDRLAASYLAQGNSSALGVAVVVRDHQTGQLQEMLLNYGLTAKYHGQPVGSTTVYEIGSITKVFTGILLAQAVASGAVQISDPIQKYLPAGIEAPTYRDMPIRLQDLATHRAGLPRDLDSDTLSDLYTWLNQVSLARAPGSEYSYSNAGYSLLGDILARLSGTDFATLEYQSVSQPLGLIDTREALTADETDRQAQGYGYDGSPADYFPQSGAMSGAAYLHSTLADMTRFLVANMQPDSTPLSAPVRMAQTLQAGGKNPDTGIGLGWDIARPGTTHEIISKGGGTSGFTSYISFMSDGSTGFVLLNNGMYAETLVPHMLQILSGY
jgi:D-alanyl-D-alanine-carboxypeptidase/D-alanyl-D-alanine-endopeptidase